MNKDCTAEDKKVMIEKGRYIAELAKTENLEKVNGYSKKVYPKKSFYLRYGKRALDLMIAIPACIIFAPLNIMLAFATLLDVGKPILFYQMRIGKDGTPFSLVKFRNMTDKKDLYGNLLPPRQRVTKFGAFVRKYSLDELLNFWSILKGEMSFIGPRPLPIVFQDRFSERHRMREAVRPGLECPGLFAKNRIRYYQEQFEDDIWYVENVSFLVDCKLCLRLIQMVLNTRERNDHAIVGGGEFLGYNENGNAFSMRNIPPKYEEAYQRYIRKYGK